MLVKTNAIVLHSIKYTDNSLIVYLYTSVFGRQTYIVNGLRSGKSKNRISLFQPLFLLETEAYNRPKSDIQRLKEFKLAEPLVSIPFDIKKSSVAMFLAEVLYKTIQEEEANNQLFNYIYNSILVFDKMKSGYANFHLYFLANLSKFLGFYPENAFTEKGFFDIKNGTINQNRPPHNLFFDEQDTAVFQKMLSMPVGNMEQIELTRSQRENFLASMLTFYNYHFDHLSPINSLKIFKEVFG